MLRWKARLPPRSVSTTSANDRCMLGLKPASLGVRNPTCLRMQELHRRAQGELFIHEILKELEFGVAKPTSISPLRIHSTAQ